MTDDKLRKLFGGVDIDESGNLSLEEFMEFLKRRFNVQPSREILVKILKEIDEDNDGNIDEDEFLQFFAQVRALADSQKELNKRRYKKRVPAMILNAFTMSTFLSWMYFGLAMARQCEYTCQKYPQTCEGKARSDCTWICIYPRDFRYYIANGLLFHLLFYMSSELLLT